MPAYINYNIVISRGYSIGNNHEYLIIFFVLSLVISSVRSDNIPE